MFTLIRSSLASVPRTSSRYPCRRISNRRFPQPNRCFHQSPRPRTSAGGNNKSDDAITNGDTKNESENLHAEDAVPQTDSCTALSAPPLKNLAHYGSAVRRSKRNKSQEVTPSVRIPQWFVDKNVRAVEDNYGKLIRFLRWDAERAEYVDAEMNVQSNPGDAPDAELLEDGDNPSATGDAESATQAHYYVDSFQWDELVYTARGLLKPTTPFVANDLASQKNHLILHYAGEGGDYLLDELIHLLAISLHADTVVLDALDIADLACEPHNSSLSEDAADDRRLLSYEVYQKEDGQSNDLRQEEEQANESDEHDEDHDPRSFKPAIPTIFMDIQGLPLGLPNNGLPRRRRSHRHMDQPGPMIPNLGSFLAGRINRDQIASKPAPQPLLSLIEALLAGPYLKRTMRNNTRAAEKPSEPLPAVASEQNESPLILEIRDIKLVQQTSFGQKFLHTLYDYVKDRRLKGRKMMIIGTESFPKADQYSADNIRNLQSEPEDHISRTMVITPVVPSLFARSILRKDKKRRTRTINMQHLWQMLCIKVPELYENNFVRQEWASHTDDLSNEASFALDLVGAGRELWTFDQVHRLAIMVVGQLESGVTDSLKVCLHQACIKLKGSDNAKFAWTEQQKSARTKSKPDMERRESQRLDQIRKKLTRHEKKLVGGIIEPHKITTTFDHVHAPLDTIDALKTLTTLSLVRPDAFKYGVLASDKIPGLLLYGPPGTGKTLLAKAVAKESGATVLEVSGAGLNDMYVGEGEKNVRALFSLAKKLTPCVVFIDECDAVFSARGSGQRRVSHRDILNQFLREWDGMSNDSGSAFIMMATNRPFDLDDAVLRRLPRRLLVDLPTENDRLEILKIHLRDETLAEDVNLADLAAKTPFYSGSDLKNLAVAAALNCVREENEQAKNHTGEDPFEHADKRTLKAAHFDRALEDISASISEDMNSLKEIKKFDEQFGDNRGKKKRSSKWGFNTVTDADKAPDTVKVRS
jgi:SpoVK/Ycf46/Vps4 family AAA+-type ATPase